jgi:gliding motility-associated-like protein
VQDSITLGVTQHIQAFIPNAFTPNGDGNNNYFQVYGVGIKFVTMKIFNRWGEKVYESENMMQGWDGTFKGQPQDMGVFVYEAQITYLSNLTEFRKGSVTLIR